MDQQIPHPHDGLDELLAELGDRQRRYDERRHSVTTLARAKAEAGALSIEEAADLLVELDEIKSDERWVAELLERIAAQGETDPNDIVAEVRWVDRNRAAIEAEVRARNLVRLGAAIHRDRLARNSARITRCIATSTRRGMRRARTSHRRVAVSMAAARSTADPEPEPPRPVAAGGGGPTVEIFAHPIGGAL